MPPVPSIFVPAARFESKPSAEEERWVTANIGFEATRMLAAAVETQAMWLGQAPVPRDA